MRINKIDERKCIQFMWFGQEQAHIHRQRDLITFLEKTVQALLHETLETIIIIQPPEQVQMLKI